MWAKQSVKRSLALVVILLMGGFLALALWPYRNAFFGALVLFFLFRPFYQWLCRHLHWRPTSAALLMIVLSLIMVLVPVSLLASLVLAQSIEVLDYLKNNLDTWTNLSAHLPLAWREQLSQELYGLVNNVGGFFVVTVRAVGGQVINYTIMYFIFFYLLVTDEDRLRKLVIAIMPFSKANTVKLQQEFRNITHSTVIASGCIAVGQAGLLTLGLFMFGVPGALVLGFLGLILAFMPLVGVPVIWVPSSAWLLATGQVVPAIGLLVWGFLISTIDNFVRPMLQNRIGHIHPVISILGVFIGLSFFGLLGVVVGPLILSYFVLTVKMFNQEYIDTGSNLK
jgi:predicted PurR-regulated permease PerM